MEERTPPAGDRAAEGIAPVAARTDAPGVSPGAYEARFSAIFESTPLGIRLYRLEADGTLRLEACNTSCDRLLGIEHARLVGLPIEQAFPGVDETGLPDRLRSVVRTGQPWEAEQLSYHDERIAGVFEVRAFRVEADTKSVFMAEAVQKSG